MSDSSIAKIIISFLILLTTAVVIAQETDVLERFRQMSLRAEEKGTAEPFRGIMIGAGLQPDLFPIKSTGVSTAPVRIAADAFLTSLTGEQRAKTLFAADDLEWRKWMNQHFYQSQGVRLDDLTEAQRESALNLLRASLSAKGMQLSRDIMRLNHTLGELAGDNFIEFGEWLYSISIMGEPSSTEPWGWQLDGHHLIINYFVLGDQVVMSPAFFGSEPVIAKSGKFKGVAILQEEQDKGLAFMKSLSKIQQELATLSTVKESRHNLGEAYKDNISLDFAGIAGRDLSDKQKENLLGLIRLYIGNMSDGHADVKMEEVATHLDATWFAWIGETKNNSVYYYRILSPVLMIEFDHQGPANLRELLGDKPTRQHIHAVVRTPNGNDYGKDLLRQHYSMHAH